VILTDTPLITNLNNPEYHILLLNGKSSIEERFVQIDIKIIREKLQQEKNDDAAMLPKVKRIIKRPGFFQTIQNKIGFDRDLQSDNPDAMTQYNHCDTVCLGYDIGFIRSQQSDKQLKGTVYWSYPVRES
jgi:hypothetical protein